MQGTGWSFTKKRVFEPRLLRCGRERVRMGWEHFSQEGAEKPDSPGRLELPVGRRTWRRGTEKRPEELAGCTKDSGLLLRGDVT